MKYPFFRYLVVSLLFGASLQAAVPTAPDSLNVAPLGTESHVIRWADTPDETGYLIERENGASWDLVATVGSDVTLYVESGLPSEELPTYRVSAFNGEGSSAPTSGVRSLRMNVLFFYADDMGFKDVVANRNIATDGPTIYETPSLDTLVSQGVNYTRAYCSGPKCVVARRAMQTGMYDFREVAVSQGGGIGPEMVTIGEAMKAGGYRTCFIGKWHLGGKLDTELTPHGVPDYQTGTPESDKVPAAQGYDVSIAAGEYGAPPISYFATEATTTPGEFWYGLPDLYTNDSSEYLTNRLTDEATGFIGDHLVGHASEPFFLMLAHYAVHTPLEAPQEDVDYFDAKKDAMVSDFASHPAGSAFVTDYTSRVRNFQDQTTYAAMVKSFDESLASIRSYLSSTADPRNPGKQLSETTIIVFSSDHGGKSTHFSPKADEGGIPTSNYPLRLGKTWCYEGGLKVPLVVYWPGISAAGASSEALVNGADFYTTFLDMTGTQRVPTQHLDSISFAETVFDPSVQPRDESFHWFTNADDGTGNTALGVYRKGDYKLVYDIIRRTSELYNLAQDPSESDDIASIRADLAAEMLAKLIAKRDEVEERPTRPGSNSWDTELAVLSAVMAIPPLPDGPPSDLGGSAVSATAIDLQWSDGSTNEERFVIARKIVGSGGFDEVATVPANVTHFRDTGLVPGTSYQYRIEAETLAGWNGPSNQVTIATPLTSDPLPMILRGDAISVLKNEPREFEPLLNDQGEGMALSAVSTASKGVATISGNRIVYVPNLDAVGSETLSYTVTDVHGATARGMISILILEDLTVTSPPVFDLSPVKTLVDAWEFDDPGAPVTLGNCANSVSGATSTFSGSDPVTDGGNLSFGPSSSSSGGSFRASSESSPGSKIIGASGAGVYEMAIRFTSADLSGGSSDGAYVSVAMRDSVAKVELAAFRLQEKAGNLELQFRGDSVNSIVSLTGAVLGETLEARAVVDLESQSASVYYKLGGAEEVSAGSYLIEAGVGSAVNWDQYRISSLNNTTDWGASDFVKLDYISISEVVFPEPPGPFLVWVSTVGNGAAPADLDRDADPDADLDTNFGEFAFGSNAFDSGSQVRTFGAVSDTAGDMDLDRELLLTVAIRVGAVFSSTGMGPLEANIDGVSYQVRGSVDLQSYEEMVEEVFPAMESGLPPVARGWSYRTFRLTSTNGLSGSGFLQAVADEAP
jgi:arylsulfatase A-like enzyme